MRIELGEYVLTKASPVSHMMDLQILKNAKTSLIVIGRIPVEINYIRKGKILISRLKGDYRRAKKVQNLTDLLNLGSTAWFHVKVF